LIPPGLWFHGFSWLRAFICRVLPGRGTPRVPCFFHGPFPPDSTDLTGLPGVVIMEVIPGVPRAMLLKRGHLIRERDVIRFADSSVTLVVAGNRTIVVDTAIPSRERYIVNMLERCTLSPGDVDTVINTHLHPDHVGCNHLFGNAEFLVHREEAPRLPTVRLPNGKEFAFVGDGDEIADGVRIMHVPGHSEGSIAVMVKGLLVNAPDELVNPDPSIHHRKIVIAGDALPTFDNYHKMVPPALNYDPRVALGSMKKIIAAAEVVIPGHDDIIYV